MNDQAICPKCGRVIQIWDTTEHNIKCPMCDHVGKNPYYQPKPPTKRGKPFIAVTEKNKKWWEQ